MASVLAAKRMAQAISRPAGAQVRRMSTSKPAPKNIVEKQAFFNRNPAVGADNPTYLKAQLSDQIATGVVFAGLGVGLVMALRGLLWATFGTHKIEPQ